MAIRALLLLCSVCAIAGALPRARAEHRLVKPSQWSPCASKNYPVTIKDVSIIPDPVVAGSLATFTIPAYTESELSGGTIVVTVLFHGIKVHTEKHDICSKAACPLKGEFTLNNAEALPALTPPGSYKLKFQVLDTVGNELSCVSVSFNIVWTAGLEQVAELENFVSHRRTGRKFGDRAFKFAQLSSSVEEEFLA